MVDGFEVKDALIVSMMLESGIVPLSALHDRVCKQLEALSPEDARVAKRKFRKAWRRAAKNSIKIYGRRERETFMTKRYGLGTGQQPTAKQKHNRKSIVYTATWRAATSLLEATCDVVKRTLQDET